MTYYKLNPNGTVSILISEDVITNWESIFRVKTGEKEGEKL